ncbi:hypothetical protein LSM04_007688 [Trypanosoma melophagium]|uniref:uncharacterized protein n=1 Tax=Trypanosoma melophagium TaxID=715481 RepID=UPI00351A2AC6|nr:hypothetical protein LSM04_007688 [Trypanosoma melophagium]
MMCNFSHVLVTFLSLLLIFGYSQCLVADATTTTTTTNLSEKAALTPFRCMRPFASLPRFSPSVMNAAENCKFGPFRIVNASAVPNCTRVGSPPIMRTSDGQSSQGEHNDKMLLPGCNAVIRIVLKMEDENGFKSSQSKDLVENDIYRFALHLRAFNDSVVHYKGFDQNGYSMCCDLLQEAECVWKKNGNFSQSKGQENSSENTSTSEKIEAKIETATIQRELVVVSCPLYNNKISQGGIFHGSLIKPLHRLAVTGWEARLEFWRGVKNEKEILGRLLLPFRLTENDIVSFNESNRATGTAISTDSWNNVGGLVEGKTEGVRELNREDDL